MVNEKFRPTEEIQSWAVGRFLFFQFSMGFIHPIDADQYHMAIGRLHANPTPTDKSAKREGGMAA